MPDVDLLDRAYADLAELALSLDEPDSWRTTGCPGWAVRDLLFHLLGDAQRALVALATPTDAEPDRSAVTYWLDAPGQSDPDSRELRSVRTMASAWKREYLVRTYAETTRAAVALARRADPRERVTTQGHVLTVTDFVGTLVTEAVVHHLDLVVDLDRPGPCAAGLSQVAGVLDGLLGRPAGIETRSWVLLGTGRRPVTSADRETLGDDADRLPLLR